MTDEHLDLVFDDVHTLNPGIDWYNDTLYYTIPARVNVTKLKGRGKEKVETPGFDTITIVITSKRTVFRFTEDSLYKRGFAYPTTFTAQDEPRWQPEDWRDWITEGPVRTISPHAIYATVREVFTEHIEYQHDIHYDLATMYVLASYVFPIWEALPYIHFNGTRASGKSQNLRIFEALAFNTSIASNMTEAALFRTAAGNPGLMCLDEAETFDSDRGKELKLILNAGYKRNGNVRRTERGPNDVFRPIDYHVYGPKILASINSLEPVLGSRCIVIPMLPTIRHNIPTFKTNNPRWQTIRNDLYIWALQNAHKVAVATEACETHKIAIPDSIRNRDWELATVFYSLATYFENDDLLAALNDYFTSQINRRRKEADNERQIFYLRILPRALQSIQPHDGNFYPYSEIFETAKQYMSTDEAENTKSRSLGRYLKPLLGGEVETKRIPGGKGQAIRLDEEAIRAQFKRRDLEPYPEDVDWLAGKTSYQQTPNTVWGRDPNLDDILGGVA